MFVKHSTCFVFQYLLRFMGFMCTKSYGNVGPGEDLCCRSKVGISYNLLSMAIIKQIGREDTILGHVPRKISALCNDMSTLRVHTTAIHKNTYSLSSKLFKGTNFA